MPSRLRRALLLGLAAAAPTPADVVDRILAVVDGRPVLLSDVRLLEEVKGLPRERALEAVIDERLMFGEASRVPQAGVKPDEEDRALARLYEDRPVLRDRVAEGDLRRLVRRQLAVLKYVEFRFRPQVRVSPEDVQKAHAAEYAGKESAPSLAAVSGEIEARLVRAALDERVESWVRELRSAAAVRYNR